LLIHYTVYIVPKFATTQGVFPGCPSLNFQKNSANGVNLGRWERKKAPRNAKSFLHMPIGLIGQLITAAVVNFF